MILPSSVALARRENRTQSFLEERINAAKLLRRAFTELKNVETMFRLVREEVERSLDAEDVDTLLLSWRQSVIHDRYYVGDVEDA